MSASEPSLRLSRAAATLAPWDIDVSPDGAGLPAGRGSVAAGKAVYDAQCAGCHGATGEGGLADRLVGGAGTLASGRKVKTIGSFWPYATTLYDFINRAMPSTTPQSLGPDEVYAVSASAAGYRPAHGGSGPLTPKLNRESPERSEI